MCSTYKKLDSLINWKENSIFLLFSVPFTGLFIYIKAKPIFYFLCRVPSDESLYSGFCGQVTVAEDQSSGSQYCECGTGLTPQCRASPVSDCGSFSKASSKKKGKSKKRRLWILYRGWWVGKKCKHSVCKNDRVLKCKKCRHCKLHGKKGQGIYAMLTC